MKSLTYSGRISSSGSGLFFSAGETVGSISLLPTALTENFQNVFVGTSDPVSALEKFPRLTVTLQADGTVKSLETDVIAIDSNGEQHTVHEMAAQIAPPKQKAVAQTQPQATNQTEEKEPA